MLGITKTGSGETREKATTVVHTEMVGVVGMVRVICSRIYFEGIDYETCCIGYGWGEKDDARIIFKDFDFSTQADSSAIHWNMRTL